MAKRVVSLQPIHRTKDVKRQLKYEHVTNDDEAMLSAVKEYLECEMKCKNPDVPKIVNIFPPANSTEYDRLYVEFDTEQSAQYVNSFSRFLNKRDHQVSI